MSLAEKYRKSLAKEWCIRFKTSHPGGDRYYGVVRKVAPEFIVLRCMLDFEFDGIVLLPKKVIRGVRDGRFEKCSNAILRANRFGSRMKVPKWLDACATLPQVILALKDRDIWPIVEIISGRGKDSVHYLGPITRTAADGFFLLCYDADGKWEKEYEIEYVELFRIEFDSKYCNQFNEYMRKRLRKPGGRRHSSPAVARLLRGLKS